MSTIDDIAKKTSANGKFPQARLKFFTDFLAMEDLTLDEVANIIGMTRPAISHWLSSDDARLDQIQQVVEARGYELEIFLTRDGAEADGRKRISIDDFITLDKAAYRPKRLSFLTLALKRYNLTKTELAESCGLTYSSARHWFMSDTITMSRLFQICEVANFSIRISITKKTLPEDANDIDGRRKCTILISKETVTNL